MERDVYRLNNQPYSTEQLPRPSESFIKAALKTNEVVAVGCFGIALGAYLYSQYPEVNESLLKEISNTAFRSGVGLAFSGEVVKRTIFKTEERSGKAPVPKGWKNHEIVFDIKRGIFNALVRADSDGKKLLVHDGSQTSKGELIDPFYTPNQRHLSTEDPVYLPDRNTLERAGVDRASRVVINMWDPHTEMYRTNSRLEASPLLWDQAANILETLSLFWDNKEVVMVVPQQYKINDMSVLDYFTSERYEGLRKLMIVTPETAAANKLARKVWRDQKKFQKELVVAIDSRMEEIQEGFSVDMRKRGIKVGSIDEANIVIVDEDTDGKVVTNCYSLRDSGKEIIAILARKENVPLVEARGGTAWPLSDIVAQSVPISFNDENYTLIYTSK